MKFMADEHTRLGDNFVVEVIPASTSDVIFTANIFEVVSRDVDTDVPVEIRVYGTAIVNWDSCSHWSFHQQLHFCDVDDYKAHIQMVKNVYHLAFKCMNRDPQHDQEWD